LTAALSKPFLTIVEVFPPSFSAEEGREPVFGIRQKKRDFVERVKRIQYLADAILVADVKDTSRYKLSSVQSAALLRDSIGIEAIPVITARDSNRSSVSSAILTAFSLGLDHLMLVWGDKYSTGDGASNVYDFLSLAELIASARNLGKRSGIECTIFAPLNTSLLGTARGRDIASSRLASGAAYLLAQPPTTDASAGLANEIRALEEVGLKDTVLPNVFPFRDAADINACRTRFGWEIPERMVELASRGESALLAEARKVVRAIREAGFPGVYVSTRGHPELARYVLG